ncbi:Rossmann-like and DUF2520 domain-containing protein [Microbacterium sp. H1-D42]|uniref:Rossmann-like and DUF2520 domain-containing protein n=1 Tax=Microbacterium sp. H1-D42 TaxID=2925844 RepID=UPI001F536C71|nr:Rossmann-like and DUF2520 domain-containing protein [Microbacterium sp. H1-D42]UNK70673.1 DUF2520 domain-containing protein [Microbacterium sp. H1-D42]
MPLSAAAPHETTIAVVGAGRLGTVLARALRAAGFDVRGPLVRDEIANTSTTESTENTERIDIALLCVPDSAISDAADAARPHADLIGHVSGATSLDSVDFSIHPLQTFTGTEAPDVFHGIGAAVAGRTPEALATAEQLARALGARPVVLDDAHRAEYHAAASFASNFVLTVLDAAEQLAHAVGIPRDEARDLLAPLVRQSVDNWVAVGAKEALTGPIARGDHTTVARQRTATVPLDLEHLFDALADSTRVLAERPAA